MSDAAPASDTGHRFIASSYQTVWMSSRNCSVTREGSSPKTGEILYHLRQFNKTNLFGIALRMSFHKATAMA